MIGGREKAIIWDPCTIDMQLSNERELQPNLLPEQPKAWKDACPAQETKLFQLSRFCPVTLPAGVAGGVDLIRFGSEINHCRLLSEEDELQNQALQTVGEISVPVAQICRCEPPASWRIGAIHERDERKDGTDRSYRDRERT